GLLGAGLDGLSPRYTCAMERMSMRPEPSPCAIPALEPLASEAEDEDEDDEEEEEDEADARGESLASAARLLSENRTEFSLRWPVIGEAALAGAAAAAAIPPPALPKSPPSSSSPDEEELAAAAAIPPPANRSLGA